MILGVGNDIIEVARIRTILTRYPQRFLSRVFTPFEQEYCLKRKDPAIHLSGRFAAKEAIVKALGVGFSQGLSWLDIEIRNDEKGKPSPYFSEFAKELFDELHFCISISHCHEYATAFAIWTERV
jgi:holo-[acyl-carrier protein] synthase